MSNPNKHIEDFLNYYFELESSPHYAVMLKGNWGVGKTWFLRDVMKKLTSSNDQTKKYLYVSLYGVESVKDIEDEFFRELYPLLSSKGIALAGKITKSIVETFNFKVPEVDISDYLTKTKDLILVFDDLERASMDKETLLGYINYYVEHQGYKVIIIANEEELLNDKVNIKFSYRRIKEKLIGKTFEIQPQLDLAINNFILEIDSIQMQEFFRENLSSIKEHYQISGYKNLRHLRQALMDFTRLVGFIPVRIKDKQGVLEELLSIFLVLSFEIKSGNMSSDDINKIEDFYITELSHESSSIYINEEEKVDSFYVKLREKYPTFDPFDMLLEKSSWVDIFDRGLIDKEKIEESLQNSKFFYNDNQPDWIRLWHFIILEDEEFNEALDNVYNNLKSGKYEDTRVIKHITGIFLEFSEENIINKTKKEVLELAKLNIDKLFKKGVKLSTGDGFYDNNSSYGLGYYNKNDKEFQTLNSYILSLSKRQVSDSLPPIGEGLLKDIKSNISDFSEKIFYTGSVTEYNLYPVLKYIEPIDFVTAILEISPDNRRQVVLAISSRYRNSGDIGRLIPEIVWLQKIVYLLLHNFKSGLSKIRNHQIKILIDAYFIPAIINLNRATSKHRKAENYMWTYYDKSYSYLRTTCLLI